MVRHAERTGSTDQLNSQGLIRAQELSRILDESNISAIFASTANRTQQTAATLSTQIGVSTSIYNALDLPSLVNEIKSIHKGQVVLVVGHSNTVPQTINLLGITPTLSDIPHNEYDNLYIVTICNNCDPRLIHMEYGNDTP